MKQKIIVDTGPLVALINDREQFHPWVTQTVANLVYPFLTCEAVITETCFLLQDVYGGEDAVMGLIASKHLKIAFRLDEEIQTVKALMKQYKNVPMSLADACLVRMNELIEGSCVLTLDSDFRIYRKNRISDAEKASFAPICPDFAIELRSKSDSLKGLQSKMEEYLENGVSLGWLIDRQNRTVHIYRPNQEPQILESPDIVNATPELSGFQLSMAKIW